MNVWMEWQMLQSVDVTVLSSISKSQGTIGGWGPSAQLQDVQGSGPVYLSGQINPYSYSRTIPLQAKKSVGKVSWKFVCSLTKMFLKRFPAHRREKKEWNVREKVILHYFPWQASFLQGDVFSPIKECWNRQPFHLKPTFYNTRKSSHPILLKA